MKKKNIILLISIFFAILLVFLILDYFNIIPKKKYTSINFDIEEIKSIIDYNNNGIDDYTDILYGAKKDAYNKPKYKSVYYDGGYPKENEGVCTDLIWRAFREAGYSLKDMIDKDILNNKQDYGITTIDKNIDFRRVKNLRVFFDKYAVTLTNDIYDIDEWMPGDIVIFENNSHIGIVSNYRNKEGISYILHNGGQPIREEDYLKRGKVTKHYRFDASIIDEDILCKWDENYENS